MFSNPCGDYVDETRRNGRLLRHEQNGNELEAAAAVEEAAGWTSGDRKGLEWRELFPRHPFSYVEQARSARN